MKIKTRILLAFLLLMAGGFYLLIDWVLDDLRPRYLEATEESLVDTANLLANVVERHDPGDRFDFTRLQWAIEQAYARHLNAHIYDLEKTRVDLRVYVTDADGIVRYDSDQGKAVGQDYGRWNDVYRTLNGEYGARSTRVVPDDPRTSILHVAAPILEDGTIVGSLTVCKPTRSANLFIEHAKRKLLFASATVVLVVVLLSVITAAWVTRPLETLTRYTADVRDGKRTVFPDLGKNEIGSMARSIDEMRKALEGKEYVENYVQTLTHEVKGPLSAIKGAVELLQEEMSLERRKHFLDNLLTETNRIQNLVDRLLLLASLEGRDALRDPEPVDLAALWHEVSQSLDAVLEAHGITHALEQTGPSTVEGERFLLRHALVNLLQNAVEFSPCGGTIQVEIRGDAQAVEISIADDGPGMPGYALGKMFDRFYSLPRPSTGKKSSGLGLSFVKEVAELHGGEIRLQNRTPTGAVATLRLDRSPN